MTRGMLTSEGPVAPPSERMKAPDGDLQDSWSWLNDSGICMRYCEKPGMLEDTSTPGHHAQHTLQSALQMLSTCPKQPEKYTVWLHHRHSYTLYGTRARACFCPAAFKSSPLLLSVGRLSTQGTSRCHPASPRQTQDAGTGALMLRPTTLSAIKSTEVPSARPAAVCSERFLEKKPLRGVVLDGLTR